MCLTCATRLPLLCSEGDEAFRGPGGLFFSHSRPRMEPRKDRRFVAATRANLPSYETSPGSGVFNRWKVSRVRLRGGSRRVFGAARGRRVRRLPLGSAFRRYSGRRAGDTVGLLALRWVGFGRPVPPGVVSMWPAGCIRNSVARVAWANLLARVSVTVATGKLRSYRATLALATLFGWPQACRGVAARSGARLDAAQGRGYTQKLA